MTDAPDASGTRRSDSGSPAATSGSAPGTEGAERPAIAGPDTTPTRDDPLGPDVVRRKAPLPPPVGIPLVVTEPRPCPYLPGRVAQDRAFATRAMPGPLYHRFMDARFRRSGAVFYQPACPACDACVPIRVPVEGFRASKSQRRTWRRNYDLAVEVGPPEPTQQKFDLYRRYLRERHGRGDGDDDDGSAGDDDAGFQAFLYDSPVDSLEFTYRDRAGNLLAVGICDVCPRSLSTVYFYFDPAHGRRGLGTFGALREIAFARERGIPFYYLGFWIRGCASMEYKADFRPHERLGADGVWREPFA